MRPALGDISDFLDPTWIGDITALITGQPNPNRQPPGTVNIPSWVPWALAVGVLALLFTQNRRR